jgi:hypothetical protein
MIDKFHKSFMKMLGEDFSNKQFGMRIYTKLMMIMELEYWALLHQNACILTIF